MKKVSIVSPCYNGEEYIGRFLEAILNQTYPKIQLIVVDDGSTDTTLNILEGFKTKFAEKGYEYIILTQKNGGQAKAINHGFQFADGEYIAWPDSDDFLFPESVSKRVEFLENNPDYGMVLSNGNEYDNNLNLVRESVVSRKQAEQLLVCILNMTAMFNNNGYLVRSSILWELYPDKKIYESPAGQNIQILFPLATACKCGYIEEQLYGRTVRNDSHSKQQNNQEKRIEDISKVFYNTIGNTKGERNQYLIYYCLNVLYSKYIYYTRMQDEKAKPIKKSLKDINRMIVKYRFKMWLFSIRNILRGRR